MEDQTDEGDSDIKKNFMVHKIKSLLVDKWDLECDADFKHVFRFLFFPMHCIAQHSLYHETSVLIHSQGGRMDLV